MFKFLAVAALVAAAPAAAVTYDAFTSFNGTQGAGGFSYGSYDGTNFTPFTANTNCFIAGSICLQAAPNFDVPGATKSAVASVQYGGVNVPTDRLLVHPGPGNDAFYVLFTAPHTGDYTVSGLFSIQDNTPTGVLLSDTLGNSYFLNGAAASVGYGNLIHLTTGSTFGFIVDKGDVYYNDSTGLNFTLTGNVPEPASWAMLIAGFGLTGAAMRRRRTAIAA